METSWWVSQGKGKIISVSQHYLVLSGWNFGCAENLGGFLLIYFFLGVCFINQSSPV